MEVVERLGRTSQGLVTTARAEAAGVSRSALSRSAAAGRLLRVRRGVYATQPLPDRPRFLVTDSGVAAAYVAQVRAVLLYLGVGATACCRTAAALYGWGLLVEPVGLVEVAVPHGHVVKVRGVRATQRRSAARCLVRVVAGTTRLRLTSPVQTVLDCALTLPLVQAVVVADSALRSGSVSVEGLALAVSRLPGWRGVAKARRVIALCDPLSGSVLESVLRVRLVLAGIDGFTTQTVLAMSPLVVRVDFCFACAGLVIEADGARWHQDAARDQARDNALAVLGWRVIRLSWAQVVHQPDQVLADIKAALAATRDIHLGRISGTEAA